MGQCDAIEKAYSARAIDSGLSTCRSRRLPGGLDLRDTPAAAAAGPALGDLVLWPQSEVIRAILKR